MQNSLTESDIFNIVIGTAGHIDHGKSALVEKLTGINPDRLKEERERGMTIDLGFAPFVLEDGRRVGIVDVPGHERFIKNMVAGASGIDAVILVVAADDGVMPQTREHMDIMGLLGITRGIVAITKVDVVDEELRELVIDDVQRYLRGTFMENEPILCTSSVTGEGLEEMGKALNVLAKEIPMRPTEGIFRMPIQRVFSAKGHGTVVTGIPVSGKAHVGDPLEIQPGGHRGRVRGVQAYHCSTDSARAGHSSALNLSDVNYREVHRGQVVVPPDTFQAERLIEVKLQVLPSVRRGLKHFAAVRLHTGTTEELGRIAILEGAHVKPGESSYAQIRLESPVVVAPGDRFVLRLHSPMITVGGGEVIGASRWRLKAGKGYVIDRLREKEAAVGRAEMTVASLVREAGLQGIGREDLKRASCLQPKEFTEQLEGLKESGLVVELKKPVRFIHAEGLAEIQDRIVATLRDFHAREPLRLRMQQSGLDQKVGAERQPVELALRALASDGKVIEEDGGLRLQEHQVNPSARQEEILERLLETYREKRYATPRRDELPDRLGEQKEDLLPILLFLLERGDLVEVAEDVIFHRDAVEEAARVALEIIEKEGELTVIRFKDTLGTTRKYIVPLLEHLDVLGVTIRDGNRRLAAR